MMHIRTNQSVHSSAADAIREAKVRYQSKAELHQRISIIDADIRTSRQEIRQLKKSESKKSVRKKYSIKTTMDQMKHSGSKKTICGNTVEDSDVLATYPVQEIQVQGIDSKTHASELSSITYDARDPVDPPTQEEEAALTFGQENQRQRDNTHSTPAGKTLRQKAAKERFMAAKARAKAKRLEDAKKREHIKAEEADLLLSPAEDAEAKLKLRLKEKADEEWTKRERAARNEWVAEQEQIAKFEAEDDESAKEGLEQEQEEKTTYAVPHMLNIKPHHPSTPPIRGPTNLASLDSLLCGLPSANSSSGSLASKKKKSHDDRDDASIFTETTKASFHSTARSVASNYSHTSTTSKKGTHYSRAHETANVAEKVKEAYKARLQQYHQEVLPNAAVLKTTPQWERYYLKDQGRTYSAEDGKLWSQSSYKQNVNGNVKRGSPVWGKDRLKATRTYLNNAYRAKLDDLDGDVSTIA